MIGSHLLPFVEWEDPPGIEQLLGLFRMWRAIFYVPFHLVTVVPCCFQCDTEVKMKFLLVFVELDDMLARLK